MTNTSSFASHRSPEQVADLFIRAVIRNDTNEIGRLLGIRSTDGKPMNQVFGKRLGAALTWQAAQSALKIEDHKWNLKKVEQNEREVQFQVDLYIPDTVARAKRIEELLGYKTGTDGTLKIPDKLPMSYEEAVRRAATDASIKPVHYQVPLYLINKQDEWIIDPNGKNNDAVVSVIRQGQTYVGNQPYRKP